MKEGLAHYLENIGHMAEVEYLELKDQASRKGKEAESIQEALLKRKYKKVFLLDERGKEFSSEEFASFLGKLRDGGQQQIAFVVGGAYGFTDELRALYPKISLSKMTFPHDLARLFLAEQLYRALHILSGGKYHHGE